MVRVSEVYFGVDSCFFVVASKEVGKSGSGYQSFLGNSVEASEIDAT